MAKKHNKIYLITFITLEIVIAILVQLTSGVFNTIVSFSAVVFAFIYSILNYNKFTKLIVFGLFTTVCADIFLVVCEPMKQNIAMCFFSITQICYFIYIYNNQTHKQQKLNIIIRTIIIVLSLLITILVLKENTDFLSLIALFYYANLIVNGIFSLIVKNKNICLSIGLILFACCDLVIGFSIMSETYIPLKEGTALYFIANSGFNLAWIFYVPSQTMISIATKKDYNLN